MPIEILKNSINKKIQFITRKEKIYDGILVGFDEHLNIHMKDVHSDNNLIGEIILNGGSLAIINILNK